MNRKFALGLLALPLALALSACSPSAEAPEETPVIASTLDGGVIEGDGVSIRQADEADYPEEIPVEPSLIRVSDNSFMFELGGSSSKACASNFTAVERNGEEFTLTHRSGEGAKDAVCTADYQFTYFLVEADEPISDDALANILVNGNSSRVLTFAGPVDGGAEEPVTSEEDVLIEAPSVESPGTEESSEG